MMVTMAGLQVFIVRFFFQGARKGMFCCLIVGELELTLWQVMCERYNLQHFAFIDYFINTGYCYNHCRSLLTEGMPTKPRMDAIVIKL